jgi:lipopolysaccharide/colanic/teichoic acid biosynthesis glycosyltransferase
MRRAVDIVVAAVALVALSPLMLILAAVVAIDSPGGPLYRGWRVGQGGRRFRIWKFRTMAGSGPAITGSRDPRITPVGRWLRRTKLDELPQLFNVLTGRMTLVGPRPEAPEIVARYGPELRMVLAAKPGVTGRAQIEAPEESESIPPGVNAEEYYVANIMDPKVRRDLEYLGARTAASDARIVFATIALVFRSLTRRRGGDGGGGRGGGRRP